MDFVCNFPLFTILLGLLCGLMCTLLKAEAARRLTLWAEAATIGLCASILAYTLRTGTSFTYVLGEFPAPWGNELRAGPLEALCASAFSGVLFCSVLGGKDYLSIDIDGGKQNLFCALVNLVTAALMALIWTNDLFTGYVFLEIMTLASCGLVAARECGRTTLAAVRYMVMNLLGSGLFLLGVVLTYALTGHLLMVPAHGAVEEIFSGDGKVPLVFALTVMTVGLGIKSGLFPAYFWMPDTYGSATPAAAAILSALVSKGYLFLLVKIYCRVVGMDVWQQLPLRWVVGVLGVMGMAAGSVSALRSKNINRMAAYSSAAQIGYIFVGLGIGGAAGFGAAVFQMLAHAVTKALIFITTPRLAAVSGESLLFERLKGSGRRDGGAGFFFTAAALSMVGVPFFAGFSVKLLLSVSAAEYGDSAVLIAVLAALGVSSVLNALYFIRTAVLLYVGGGEEQPAEERKAPRASIAYYFSAAVLTLGNLYLGLSASSVLQVIRQSLTMFG